MKKKTEARVVKSMLTVGFHAATPPMIWRFDLDRNHSFTVSLQGDEGDWELGVTSPKGEFYPVSHFDAREDAEEAVAKVERALMRRSGLVWVLLKSAVGVALLGAFITLGVILYSVYAMIPHHSPLSTPSLVPGGEIAVPEIKQGVPLSADDVLQPPR